jgi:hypothetical protein
LDTNCHRRPTETKNQRPQTSDDEITATDWNRRTFLQANPLTSAAFFIQERIEADEPRGRERDGRLKLQGATPDSAAPDRAKPDGTKPATNKAGVTGPNAD